MHNSPALFSLFLMLFFNHLIIPCLISGGYNSLFIYIFGVLCHTFRLLLLHYSNSFFTWLILTSQCLIPILSLLLTTKHHVFLQLMFNPFFLFVPLMINKYILSNWVEISRSMKVWYWERIIFLIITKIFFAINLLIPA